MKHTIFVCRDGSVIDNGSLSSGGECCVVINDRLFLSVATIHGRQVFMEVSHAEWAAWLTASGDYFASLDVK